MKASRLLLLAGALALAGGLRSLAQEPKSPPPAEATAPGIWISEVDRDPDSGEVRVLLNVGREAGLERGDLLTVEREGRTIAKAKVWSSYADMAIAQVTEGQKDVARGDWVRAKPRMKLVSGSTDEDPLRVVAAGTALRVQGGLECGLREGQEATVTREGKPVGKVKLTAVGDKTSTLVVLEGDCAAGDKVDVRPAEHERGGRGSDPLEPTLTRDELRRMEREAAEPPKGLDFVATDFLGVVAEIEHPGVVFLAPCHYGVLVKRIIVGSPGDKAGIRPGDRVIAIDDRVVRTAREIFRGIKRRPGDYVKVTIARDDMLQTVTADFRKR
jgi:hypothetical protein